MAKEKKEKKDKSSKKSKIEEPVADKSTRVGKKDKKEKKSAISEDAASALLDTIVTEAKVSEVVVGSSAPGAVAEALITELVPFALPLAQEKETKKVLKCVKKGAKNKCLKRGVKEVVKALRKSPAAAANASTSSNGLVVLAADISPMDVISHIPVLCEDHGIPYIFVTSRAELGAAGATKRPTSVVMVLPGAGKKGKKGEEVEEGFKEAYDEAVKLVEDAQKKIVY